MQVKTLSYVSASELFGDDSDVWDAFAESEPDCSWGDNEHTLVTKDVIKRMDEEGNIKMMAVFYLLDKLPEGTLIDLET